MSSFIHDQGAEALQTSINLNQWHEDLANKKVKSDILSGEDRPISVFDWSKADEDITMSAEEFSPTTKNSRSKSISLLDFNCASRALLQESSPHTGGVNDSTTILEMLHDLDGDAFMQSPRGECGIETPRFDTFAKGFRLQGYD